MVKRTYLKYLPVSVMLLCSANIYGQQDIKSNHSLKKKTDVVTNNVQSNKETVKRLYEEYLNARKLDKLNDVIHEEYVSILGEKGVAAFAEIARLQIDGFPDIKWHVQDLIAEDDKVTVRWEWTGTHKNTYRGIEATNRKIQNTAIVVYRLKDGKIVESWIQTDRLGFLQDLGIIPENIGNPQVVK